MPVPGPDPVARRRRWTLAALTGWSQLPAAELHDLTRSCPEELLPELLRTPGVLAHAAPGPLLSALLARGDATARTWAHLLTAAGLPDPTSAPQEREDRLRLAAVGLSSPQREGRPVGAAGASSALVPRWSTTPTLPQVPPTGHSCEVEALCAVPLPDGRALLASAGWDRTVRLWWPATGEQAGLLHLPHLARALAALPGEALAVAYGNEVAVLDPLVPGTAAP